MRLTKKKILYDTPAACAKGAGMVYIFISSDSFTPQVLAHESIHAANWILRDAGVRISTKNDEPLTYLTEYIMDELVPYADKKKLWVK